MRAQGAQHKAISILMWLQDCNPQQQQRRQRTLHRSGSHSRPAARQGHCLVEQRLPSCRRRQAGRGCVGVGAGTR